MLDDKADAALLVCCERGARVCALAVGTLGVAVLVGWALDTAVLKSVLPEWVTMAPGAAVGFVLAGMSLGAASRFQQVPGWRSLHFVPAIALTLLGLLTLSDCLLATNFDIGKVLWPASAEPTSMVARGHMALAAAAGFVFTGLALIFLDGREGRLGSQVAALAGVLIGILGLLGYAYGADALYAVGAYTDMAVHAAAGLVVINLGVLLARPQRGLMGVVTSNTAGGVMARRLLPLALSAPFLIGWLGLEGQHQELYGATFGAALVSLVYVVLFAGFIWRTACVLRHSDQRRFAAERARRRQQAQLSGVIDSAMDAIIMVDATQRIVLFNPAAEDMFGRKADDVLGGPLDVLLPQRFRAAHFPLAQAFGAAGMTNRRIGGPDAITGLRADGEEFPIEASISQLETNGDRFSTAILRDITARRQAELVLQAAKAEAERANNAKSRFLAAASHDLRQPLSALSLYVDVIDRHVAPAGRPLLANLKGCIGSLGALLTDLLDLSKLEAGVVTPNVCDFAVADVFAGLLSVHAPEAQLKGLRLRWVPSRLMVHSDPVLFRRILGNLLENAIRYTDRGSVLIGCRRRQGKMWVEVRDSGVGIAADQTMEIFEEFRQLGDGARTRGSGLGLAIVARTASLLGLEINLRSWPGRGSVFAVELPLGQVQPTVAPVPCEAAYRSLRIALVEDNTMVREALAHALRYAGHQVIAAGTGADLCAELGGQRPDIVVSDYRLTQRETGFDVITAVRTAMGAEVPAIIITGDTDPKLMRSMADRGIAVLHKPLELDTLQAYVEDLTHRDEIATD